MMKFIILSIFVVLATMNSISLGYVSSRNNLELQWSDWNYNIDEGNCRGNRLVYEDVAKNADQFTTKKTTYTWMGRNMYHITCIKVHNQMPRNDKAADARIIEGGVGQDLVKIEMTSKNSQRLHFIVEIWGEETRGQAMNVGLLTNTPDKVLYLGGQKYCQCK